MEKDNHVIKFKWNENNRHQVVFKSQPEADVSKALKPLSIPEKAGEWATRGLFVMPSLLCSDLESMTLLSQAFRLFQKEQPWLVYLKWSM